jgi:hypothetical protein
VELNLHSLTCLHGIVGRSVKLLLALATTAILGFESRPDPRPKFLFPPRYVGVFDVRSPL